VASGNQTGAQAYRHIVENATEQLSRHVRVTMGGTRNGAGPRRAIGVLRFPLRHLSERLEYTELP